MRSGLDDEGVAFTFDVPAIVAGECRARGRSAAALESYLATAAGCVDAWGTSVRAESAQAVADFRAGNVEEAFARLRAASQTPGAFAGYAAIATLGLIDRCCE